MKTCSICSTEKAVSEFYRHSGMADGYYSWCKKCHCERCKNNRQSDIRSYREKQRQRAKTEGHKEATKRAYKKSLLSGKHKQSSTAWRARNPEKYQAHITVRMALYHGKIKRTGCIICGEKAQAHHENYSKPLEVMWLCQAHHAEHHMRKRNDI